MSYHHLKICICSTKLCNIHSFLNIYLLWNHVYINKKIYINSFIIIYSHILITILCPLLITWTLLRRYLIHLVLLTYLNNSDTTKEFKNYEEINMIIRNIKEMEKVQCSTECMQAQAQSLMIWWHINVTKIRLN